METIRVGVSDKMALVVQHVTTFAAGFVMAFFFNAEFAGVLCVMLPFVIFAGIGMSKAIDSANSDEQEEYGEAGAISDSAFSAIRTVMSFGGQERARSEERL